MSNIVWLASYPKSGNTWARIFLNNYLLDGDAPADINNLEEGLHAGIRELFDRLTGVESSDLTPAEVNCIRPLIYQAWAAEADEPLIVKVHDAWQRNSDSQPIFPKAATKTAVYIIRNPLDIVASFANHYSQTHDETIQSMADSGYGLATSRHKLVRQLPQFLGSWHHHVLSWVENPEMPVHLLRYEDMVHDPMPTFASLVEALGLTVEQNRLAKAIRFSAFDQMKQQETAVGFKERLPGTSSFFRQGKTGGWQAELTAAQIETVCHNHYAIMQKFGYLNADGQPVIF